MKNLAKQAYSDYVARCEKAGAEFCDFERFEREWRQVARIERKEARIDHAQVIRERRVYGWTDEGEHHVRTWAPEDD